MESTVHNLLQLLEFVPYGNTNWEPWKPLVHTYIKIMNKRPPKLILEVDESVVRGKMRKQLFALHPKVLTGSMLLKNDSTYRYEAWCLHSDPKLPDGIKIVSKEEPWPIDVSIGLWSLDPIYKEYPPCYYIIFFATEYADVFAKQWGFSNQSGCTVTLDEKQWNTHKLMIVATPTVKRIERSLPTAIEPSCLHDWIHVDS